MSFYTNGEVYPKIYKSNKKPEITSNQHSYRLNYLQELLEKQQEVNHSISDAVKMVNTKMNKTKIEQNQNYDNIMKRLSKQDEITSHVLTIFSDRKEADNAFLEKFDQLEKKNEILLEKLENEGLINEAILEQLSYQDDMIKKLASNLEAYEQSRLELSSQINKQQELFEKISSKHEVEEIFHQTVMERLDQQEGNTKKIERQLDNIRAILFERASFLVEKVEENFNKISKPVQRFFLQQENKTEKK